MTLSAYAIVHAKEAGTLERYDMPPLRRSEVVLATRAPEPPQTAFEFLRDLIFMRVVFAYRF
jgi:hypothetical protein